MRPFWKMVQSTCSSPLRRTWTAFSIENWAVRSSTSSFSLNWRLNWIVHPLDQNCWSRDPTPFMSYWLCVCVLQFVSSSYSSIGPSSRASSFFSWTESDTHTQISKVVNHQTVKSYYSTKKKGAERKTTHTEPTYCCMIYLYLYVCSVLMCGVLPWQQQHHHQCRYSIHFHQTK